MADCGLLERAYQKDGTVVTDPDGADGDPASWVLRPVKCALKWAFVPRQAALDVTTGSLRSSWAASPPGTWSNALTTLGHQIAAQDGSGGCQGPLLDLTALHGPQAYPMSSCSGPMHTVAAICHLGLTVFLSIFGALAILRVLGAGVGWSPSVGGGGQ